VLTIVCAGYTSSSPLVPFFIVVGAVVHICHDRRLPDVEEVWVLNGPPEVRTEEILCSTQETLEAIDLLRGLTPGVVESVGHVCRRVLNHIRLARRNVGELERTYWLPSHLE
jgi:hypothetical protein